MATGRQFDNHGHGHGRNSAIPGAAHGDSEQNGGPNPLRYSIAQACAVLGISRTTLHERVKAGKIAIQRDGGRSFVRSDELVRYVDACSEAGGE